MMLVRRRVATVFLAAAALGVGCGGEESDSGGGGDSKSPDSPQTARLSMSDVPEGEWPLTVGEGEVRCESSDGVNAVIFRTREGKDYLVNDTAQSRELPGIDPIWKKNPDVPGTHVNIAPVLDRGLELCK
jgi:hypothetical protein